MSQNTSLSTEFSMASQERIVLSSGHEVLKSIDDRFCYSESSGHLEPNCAHLLEISSLNERNCRDAQNSQGKSENGSGLMTGEEKQSWGTESSWTLSQHMSQQAPVNRGSQQAMQSRGLPFVLSESISQREHPTGSSPQSISASTLSCEQQNEKDSDAKNTSVLAPLVNIRTEAKKRLGYFYHKFSDLYKDTSGHLMQAGAKVMSHAKHVGSMCDAGGLASPVTTFIRGLPLLEHLPQQLPLSSLMLPSSPPPLSETQIGSFSSEDGESPGSAKSTAPHGNLAFTPTGSPNSWPNSVFRLDYEDAGKIIAFKQTLVSFPEQMLRLQEYPVTDVLEHMTCSLPELVGMVKDVKGIYWLAVANCSQPDPQAACLLLLPSSLCALVLVDNCQSSLSIFHVLPLTALREIQVGFGGQSIRFLGSTEDLLLTVLTYNKSLTQQLCQDLLGVLMSGSEAAAYTNHPLLHQDLVQLSLDLKAEIPVLALANGVQLSSNFQTTLVDMVYFLHGNMEASVPSLAEVQLLLYTTVRLESEAGCAPCRSFILLNTHVALLREDHVFYPRTGSLNTLPPHGRFDVITCQALSEFRCVIVPEKDKVSKVELVFLRKHGFPLNRGSDLSGQSQVASSTQMVTPSCLEDGQDQTLDIWKLTFNSQDEALWLISYLTGL